MENEDDLVQPVVLEHHGLFLFVHNLGNLIHNLSLELSSFLHQAM